MTRHADKHFAKKVAEQGLERPEAQMGTIQLGSPRILTMIQRRNYRMWSPNRNLWSNPTTPTPALSGLAMLPFIASVAQWRIGTGREPEGD